MIRRRGRRGNAALFLLMLIGAALLVPPALAGHADTAGRDAVADLGLLWTGEAEAGKGPPGVVIALYDAAIDSRGWRYGEQVTAAGIAVLHMELDDLVAEGVAATSRDAAARARLVTALDRLDADRRFQHVPVGLLAFGETGQAALLAAAEPQLGTRIAALALLYPGCATLAAGLEAGATLPRAPMLLLHGDADPANPRAACDSLAARLASAAPVRHAVYAGAGYAWDLQPYGAQEWVKLPWPHRPGAVVPASFWPEAADYSSAQVASFFAGVLPAHGQ